MSNKISHSGIVDSIVGDCVKVRILQTSACAACKVASHCNAAESKVKIVDIVCANSAEYSEGQQVVVSASSDVARRALLLGFGLPFLVLVTVLLLVLRLSGSEGLAALSALASLVPYYLLIWLLRRRIQQHISFQIED